MNKGYVSLILHAHLPFVRHPENLDHLEERWLFEAITETYIPLIHIFEGLLKEGVPFKITMSISPPLANMLTDELLQSRYIRHIDNLIELAEKELDRTKQENQSEFYELAKMYLDIFTSCRHTFVEQYDCNLIKAFRSIQDSGNLEIMTCGATHGFLPLMQHSPEMIRGQVLTAVGDYNRHFGRSPKGIWLPECGYFPGLDNFLAEAGLGYFVVDAHGLEYAEPRPKNGVYAPVMCPSGVAAFARDLESSKQVWSSEEGYPGDYDYREFYRDVGFDLPMEYIQKYVHPDGIRLNTGLKYYRITGNQDLRHRQPYNRHNAMEKAASHASNFMFNRERQIDWLADKMDGKPLILAPYDAELYGHWWFEGPQWLNFLFRKVAYDQSMFEFTTPRHFLEGEPELQLSQPAASSWGDKGYNEVWINGSNDWIYMHLHRAGERMVELARMESRGDPLVERAVKQAQRELLLAQSSDWAFIITTKTSVEYAISRTDNHLVRFNQLYTQITQGCIDPEFLTDIEGKDNIFPDLDPNVYLIR